MLPNLKKNDDGSLTLYFQKDNLGADKEVTDSSMPNDAIISTG